MVPTGVGEVDTAACAHTTERSAGGKRDWGHEGVVPLFLLDGEIHLGLTDERVATMHVRLRELEVPHKG